MSFGTAFLVRREPPPDTEPWGEEAVTLQCAGRSFAFQGLDADQAAAVRERFAAFILDSPPPPVAPEPVVSRLHRVSSETFLHPSTQGWELWMDFDYGPTEVRAASLRLLSQLRWAPDSGDALGAVLWTSVAGGEEFLGVVENHLRLLVAYHLVSLGGVLLHSSGVVHRGSSGAGSHLFLGPSGAGKTTVARQGRELGLAVLSDDMNAVLPAAEGAGATVCRVPFAGDPTLTDPAISPEHRLPLRTLARLRQGKENRLNPLEPAAALASLAACAPFVNRDPHRQAALLENLSALLRAVPPVELEFPRTGGFWPLLEVR